MTFSWTFGAGVTPSDTRPLVEQTGRTGTRTRRCWYQDGRWHVSVAYAA